MLLLFSHRESSIDPGVKDPEPKQEEKFLFGSSNISSLSFESVAASSIAKSPFGHKTTSKSPAFAGAGAKLFASQSPGSEDHKEDHEDDNDGPHFEPVIPLPDKIEVKTGEENEEVMFSHRAKLYRFVAEEKQWKDRGVGDIKLLRNNLTGKMRVLMRREQVLKLCANHQITTDMKLQPNAGSDRSWVWSTPADFSEEECRPERLAVRFKNEEIAKQFKEKFERCQEILKEQASLKLPTQEETRQDRAVENDLLSKFKAAEGSWECDSCMLRNDRDQVECAACGTLKPGAEISEQNEADRKPLFGSGVPSSGAGFLFGSGFSFGSDGLGFSFGSSGTSVGSGKQLFSFGPAVSFGAARQSANTFGTQDEKQNIGEETPGEEVDRRKDDHTRTTEEGVNAEGASQYSNTEGASVIPDRGEERREQDVGKDLLNKWKPKEGSWECGTCLIRNDSNKVECVACGSRNPGADPAQVPANDGKPVFGSGGPSSGVGFGFGSATSSFGAGFSFGRGRPSLGAGVTFGSSDIVDKWKPKEGFWECGTCLIRNNNDKVECVVCGSRNPSALKVQH